MQSSSIADTQDSRIQENTLMTKGALDPKRIVSGVVDILSPHGSSFCSGQRFL
jgi:hypothetical protein